MQETLHLLLHNVLCADKPYCHIVRYVTVNVSSPALKADVITTTPQANLQYMWVK